jgi:hypothetical protein
MPKFLRTEQTVAAIGPTAERTSVIGPNGSGREPQWPSVGRDSRKIPWFSPCFQDGPRSHCHCLRMGNEDFNPDLELAWLHYMAAREALQAKKQLAEQAAADSPARDQSRQIASVIDLRDAIRMARGQR